MKLSLEAMRDEGLEVRSGDVALGWVHVLNGKLNFPYGMLVGINCDD